MERGVLRYLLLDALRDGPKHGYEVIKWLEERTHGLYVPSPGTVYPTLQLREDQGLVAADREDERRVYRLTDPGRAELDAHVDVVQSVWARFPDGGAAGTQRHEVGFVEDELRELARTVWAGLHSAARNGDAERVRRVRLVLERAKNEVREIIAGDAPPKPMV
jgi:DNA-binding PadR family transcriptional regulator